MQKSCLTSLGLRACYESILYSLVIIAAFIFMYSVLPKPGVNGPHLICQVATRYVKEAQPFVPFLNRGDIHGASLHFTRYTSSHFSKGVAQ